MQVTFISRLSLPVHIPSCHRHMQRRRTFMKTNNASPTLTNFTTNSFSLHSSITTYILFDSYTACNFTCETSLIQPGIAMHVAVYLTCGQTFNIHSWQSEKTEVSCLSNLPSHETYRISHTEPLTLSNVSFFKLLLNSKQASNSANTNAGTCASKSCTASSSNNTSGATVTQTGSI